MQKRNSRTRNVMSDALHWCGGLFGRCWRWYKGRYQGQPWWRKLLTALATFFALLVFYVLAVMFNFLWLFGRSPSLSYIMHPKNPQASEIYTEDGKLIGKFFRENRSNVPYDSINGVFFDALISTEDERFYHHHGIDYPGLLAAAKDAMRGHPRGASTITQQLVKNMFHVRSQYSTGLLGKVPGLGILIMKSKEMIIATELELTNSKQDILQMYANTVDFGSNAYGIKTAAKTYFNTTPEALKPEEAAVLVGLLKATSAYNPKINPDRSRLRRNVVLENMQAHGFLTRAECDSLKDLPIRLQYSVEDAYDGMALYFREAVAAYLRDNCPDLDPYEDGLRIVTTLDSRMQRYAEEAVWQQMRQVQANFDAHWRGQGDPWRDEKGRVIPGFIDTLVTRTDAYKILSARYDGNKDSISYYLNQPHRVKLFSYNGPVEEQMSTLDSLRYMTKFMHAGFVALEPGTGFVRAWVGDVDFKTWKYDKVTAMRQPGSTFKLFVYAAAMEHGFVPSDTRRDEPVTLQVYDEKAHRDKAWTPSNASGSYSGLDLPLRTAFARSVNTIAVKLGQEVGIEKIVRLAAEMGIRSPLEEKPALALGASDVNLFELANAYATVANGGMRTEPVLVAKVYNSEGKLIYEARPSTHRALSARSAFYMQKMLEAGVAEAGGTSQALQGYLGPYYNSVLEAGGKTGTTNNHSDAWFMGVTPALVGGAWVGGEYRSIHFRTGALGQGSKLALPIFGLFMQKVLADSRLRNKYLRRFTLPLENINPATYEGEAPFEADSLEIDSLALADSLQTINLMEDADLMENNEAPAVGSEDVDETEDFFE